MANGTDNDKNQALNDDGTPKKVTFDEAQQEKINELIRDAQGRAAKELREEALNAKKEAAELKARLEALEAEKATQADKPKKDADADLRAEMDRVKQVHRDEIASARKLAEAKEREAVQASDALTSMKKQIAIQSAASKVNFVDINVVTTLTKDQVKFDTELGRFTVLNDNGSVRMNASFEPTTLDEFYQEFAATYSYLVRGEVKPGAGSAESTKGGGPYGNTHTVEEIFGPKSDSKAANTLALRNPKEYQRLKAVAREKGLVA